MVNESLIQAALRNAEWAMTDQTDADEPRAEIDEAETSQAVASLEEIAVKLRELAGVIIDLNRKPLPGFPQTVH